MQYDLDSELVKSWKRIIDYGPRPFGSENLRRCSEYLAEELKKTADRAYVDTDPAEAWEITGWKLEQAEPIRREIKSYVFLNSGASEGFRGTVKYAGKNRIWNMYVWDRYMVLDEEGRICAYVTVRGGEEAIPQMLFQGKEIFWRKPAGQEQFWKATRPPAGYREPSAEMLWGIWARGAARL